MTQFTIPLLFKNCVISIKVNSQIAHKMSDLGHTPSTEKWVTYSIERDPLLLKRFKTFLRCIWKVGRASDSIHAPRIAHTVPFLSRLTLNLYRKCRFWGTVSDTQNGIIDHKKRYGLLLKWCITFLRCIRKVRGPPITSFIRLNCSNCVISTEINSQIAHKMQGLECPLSTRNGALYNKERYSLLLKVCIIFLRCIRKV